MASRDLSGVQPDPSQIGVIADVPFVRLPQPAVVFQARRDRFRALAPGHPLEAYLLLLAQIADAQNVAQAASSEMPPLPENAIARPAHGMPPLSSLLLRDDPTFATTIDRFLLTVDLHGAPEETRAALAGFRDASPEDRIDFALEIFEGAYRADRLAGSVFAAAALQVHLALYAAALSPGSLTPVADGVCPACGGAPVASAIVGWAPAEKARYCTCSLCATQWNHVRIKCTTCGSTKGITYHCIEEVSEDVAVEACGECHSYLKHFHQYRDVALDPVADDVASYGLDLLVREQGYRRGGMNPFLIIG